MHTVIVSAPGVFLGKTSERLVVRGPRPRIELIEGGPQLFLPLDLAPKPRLSVVTSEGVRSPAPPLRRPKPGEPRTTPDQIELPLFRISEIIIDTPGASLSTDLIEACCERGIRVAILSRTGRPIAMLSSPMLTATVVTRREQMAAYGDRRGVEIARTIVRGKLGNQAALLKYFGKYQKAAHPEVFQQITTAIRGIDGLRRSLSKLDAATIDDARGDLLAIEGAAGRHYWSGVRALLNGHATFDTREHRGATDPINSALNYGYGILYTQIWGAIMNAGLEPFAGFMHVDRPGKPSLVLDLIEEFRQPIVDRPVIAAVTKGAVPEVRGGMLTDDSRRAVAQAIIERLESEVVFKGKRLRMKSVIQIQARNVATFLRGDAVYRPFAFKW